MISWQAHFLGNKVPSSWRSAGGIGGSTSWKKMNASVQSLALFPLFQGFCLSWHLLYNFPLLFAVLATYQHIEVWISNLNSMFSICAFWVKIPGSCFGCLRLVFIAILPLSCFQCFPCLHVVAACFETQALFAWYFIVSEGETNLRGKERKPARIDWAEPLCKVPPLPHLF
jgi:hypothetical protein